jgi:hypothetical protein
VVELRAPGYLPQTVTLRVEQGVRYTIQRKLERDRSLDPAVPSRPDRDRRDDDRRDN